MDQTRTKPTHVRYRVTGFALSLAFLAFVQRAVMAQAAPDITAEMHLTKVQMGAILGSFSLAYALFEIPMGAYGDRFGPKRILTQVVIMWSIFTALTGAAWSYGTLWAARFLFGAGEAGCFPALTKMLGAWLPRGERIRAQSLLWACARWGGACAGPLALLGISLFGWRPAFLVFASFSLIWLVFFLIVHKDDPAKDRKVNAAELELLAEGRAITAEHGKWGKLFVNPEMLVLALQYFCFASAWIFYTTWLQTYMIDTWHVTKQQAGLYAIVPLLFGGFGCLISGFLPLKLPRRWIATGGFLGAGALLLYIPHSPNVTVAIAALGAASFCSDLTMPISWNTAAEIGRRYTGTAAGILNMIGNLGAFLAPVVSGFILTRSGNDWSPIIYIMSGLSVISALCWLIYLDPDKIARRNHVAPDAVTSL